MSISTRHDPFPVNDPYHGIYAHGVETRAGARTLRVSGQVGATPDGYLASDFRGQCTQALRNVEAVLQAAGMELTDIVKRYAGRRFEVPYLERTTEEILADVTLTGTEAPTQPLRAILEIADLVKFAKQMPAQTCELLCHQITYLLHETIYYLQAAVFQD